MLQAIIVFLSPFVQLGSSYYLSVATLAAVIGILAWWKPLSAGLARSGFAIVITLFMPLSYWSGISLEPSGDLLRVAREGVMFVILVGALIGFRNRSDAIAPPPYKLLLALAGLYLLVALAQTVYLSRGIYFGLPQQWYATDSQTLAGDLDLIYNTALRPHGTFAEPSYLGFMMVSVALMVIPRAGRDRTATAILGLVLLVGLLSRSLAFFLSMFVVLFLPFALERGRNKVALVGLMLVVTLPVVILSGDSVMSRVSGAASGDTSDLSTGDRVFGPLAALPGYLGAYPLGNPFSVIARSLLPFLSRDTADPLDILNNALFNLLFTYGLIGVAIIAAILLYARDLRVRLYLLTGAMFNGAFLAIDKVAIICLTLAVYEFGLREIRVVRARQIGPQDGSVDGEPVDHIVETDR